MSDGGSDLPPLDVIQANFDSYLGALIVQSFVSGIYTILMYRTIRSAASGLRKGSNVFLMLLLVLLYGLIMSNLSTTWSVARHTFITHNESRDAMATWLFDDPQSTILSQAGNGCGVVAILIADSLLVWRCYMLWSRNKFLLVFFGLLLLGELALIPILLKLNAMLGPAQVPIISLYLFLSMGITVVATGLIAYRVVTVSRGGVYASEYNYVVEVLVESGVLYSTILFVSSVIQVIPNASLGTFEAATYFTGILIPVTGIAPTLISARILTHTDEDEQKWSQPASFLVFTTIHKRNAGSATLNNPTQSDFGVVTKTHTIGSGGDADRDHDVDLEKQSSGSSVGNESPDLEFAAVAGTSPISPVSPQVDAPRTGSEALSARNGFM